MRTLTVAVLAVVLAGTANAAGWRSLRFDASSEDSFAKSVTAFQQKLSPARRYVFDMALLDIQRDPKGAEYRRRLDGLRYEDIVKLTDPSGATAEERYRTASARLASANPKKTAPPQQYSRPVERSPSPPPLPGQQDHGFPAR